VEGEGYQEACIVFPRVQVSRSEATGKGSELLSAALYDKLTPLTHRFDHRRFPALICLNKADKMQPGGVEGLLSRLPSHGIRVGIGVCAKEECEMVKSAIDKEDDDVEMGGGGGEGSGGVWRTLQEALDLANVVFVFPVMDLETCRPLQSMVNSAANNNSATQVREERRLERSDSSIPPSTIINIPSSPSSLLAAFCQPRQKFEVSRWVCWFVWTFAVLRNDEVR